MSNDDNLLQLAEDAYIWGYPRMICAEFFDIQKNKGIPPNQFFVVSHFAEQPEQGANVDTLYGAAWCDVEKEPLVFSMPDVGDRYYSLEMIDAYSNNFFHIGRRVTGTKAGLFLIAGPNWKGETPAGMRLIRCPTRRFWVLSRTGVDSPTDVAAANAVHLQYGISTLSTYPSGMRWAFGVDNLRPYWAIIPKVELLGAEYFDRLGDALTDDPPSELDHKRMERFARLGIGLGKHPTKETPHAELFAKAVPRAHERVVNTNVNTSVNGWSVNLNVVDVVDDELTKASINRFGLGVLNNEEATYFVPCMPVIRDGKEVAPSWITSGPDGKPVSGDHRYRLRFPPGQLPAVDSFWSLTIYNEAWCFEPNPIKRHAIGDRTAGLKYGADGSLDILIQHTQPESGVSNWLPSPKGNAQLIIRAYQPRPEFLRGEYRLPMLEIVG